MASPPHILTTFEAALDQYRDNVLMMASLAERNLLAAVNGLLRRDADLCEAAIVDDDEIDYLEKQLDGEGLEIIRRFQPVARDLRTVVVSMRIATRLERVADRATNIARCGRSLAQLPRLDSVMWIEPLARGALALYRDSVRAFSDHDLAGARSLRERDQEIDRITAEVSDQLTEMIVETPADVKGLLALLFVARHLERVGEHAKSIGKEVLFAEFGEEPRMLRRSVATSSNSGPIGGGHDISQGY